MTVTSNTVTNGTKRRCDGLITCCQHTGNKITNKSKKQKLLLCYQVIVTRQDA